ncbi:hypothetical protein KJ567_01450 [Candidatus Bipolaricaulota bacterium]|nr:hypothetical protein [Candidatus Bipolaricaulota bacterium]
MWRMIGRRLALRWDLTARVLQLAYPIVLGSLTYTLLCVVDTAMLGRLGPIPLAAGAAGVLFFAIVSSFYPVCDPVAIALTTIIVGAGAQRATFYFKYRSA